MAARAELLGDTGPSAPEVGARSAPARRTSSSRCTRGAASATRAPARSGRAGRARRARDRGPAARRTRPTAASTSASPTGSRSRRSRAAASSRARARASGSAAAGARCRPASSSWATSTRTASLPAPTAAPLRNGTFMVWRKLARTSRSFVAGCARPPGTTRDGDRSGSRPRSSAAGATARRSSVSPDSPTRLAPAARSNGFRYAGRSRRAAVPPRRAHPPRQPARRAGLDGPSAPTATASSAAGCPTAAAARRRPGRRRRARADLRLLQREHLAPVRAHPATLARSTATPSDWATTRTS